MARPPLEEPGASATLDYRVRFDECDPSGAMRAAVYLRWAQDVAWIHSERLGFDRAWYDARDLAWVVRGVQLVILSPSGSGDVLSVATQVTGYRRVWARRRTDVRTGDGGLAAVVVTDWVMTDRRGLPTRVPAEFGERFAAPPGTFEPTRIPLPPPPAAAAVMPFRVRRQELDPYGHANNAAYVDWLDEAAEAVETAGMAGVGGRIVRADPAEGRSPPAVRGAAEDGDRPGDGDPGGGGTPPGDGGAAGHRPDAAGALSRHLVVPRRYRLEYLLPTPPATDLVATIWPDERGLAYRLRDRAGRDHLRARLEPGEDEFVEAREGSSSR